MKKLFLSTVVLLCAYVSAFASNGLAITASDVTVTPGSTVVIPLSLVDADDVSGVNMNITATGGITVSKVLRGTTSKVKDGDDEYIFTFGWKSAEGQLSIYNSSNALLGSGEFANVTITIPEDFKSGTVELSNISATDLSAKSLTIPATLSIKVATEEKPSTELAVVADNVSAKPGSTVVVPLSLVNADNVSGVNMNITATGGITVSKVLRGTTSKVKDGDDEYIFTFGWKSAEGQLSIYNSSNALLGSGQFANVTITIPEDFTGGTVELSNISATDLSAKSLTIPATLSINVAKGEPAGINSVEAADAANAKAVRYNLAGQRIGANAKGIIIVNGKKILR